jgi:hypothetical protein
MFKIEAVLWPAVERKGGAGTRCLDFAENSQWTAFAAPLLLGFDRAWGDKSQSWSGCHD